MPLTAFFTAVWRTISAPFRWLWSCLHRAPAHRAVGLNAGADPQALALLAQLGVRQVRFTLYWANMLDTRSFAADRRTIVPAGTPGSNTVAGWWAVDVQALRAAGHDVLIVVHTPPAGMDLATGVTAMPAFLAPIVQQHPGLAWEIFQEQTTGDGWSSNWFGGSSGVATADQAARYATVLAPVYDAIKAVDPTATVVTGGIDHDFGAFYRALCAVVPGKFDAAGVHAYGPPALTNLRSAIDACKQVLGSVPLWITEFGNGSSDDAVQAADIGNCLAYIDGHCTGNDRSYVYTLRDADYGIVRADGSFRPAAALLATHSERNG